MIKFFRHIRRSLVNENKMGKYFKYAIGEIILVVIGILIALQVNNWNDNRKSRNTQKVLTTSIKQDLKADVAYLKNFLAQTDTLYQVLKQQSKKVNRVSYSKDSLVHFIRKEINVFIITFSGFNNNTYESMKASGKLDILPEKIKEPLFELSKLHNVNFRQYEGLRDDYFDEIEDIVKHYPIAVSFSFVKDTPQNDFVWDNVNRKDMMLNLNSWGSVKANYFRNISRSFKNWQKII